MNFIKKLIEKKKYAKLPTIYVKSKILKHKMYPPTALRKKYFARIQTQMPIGVESCTPLGHAEDKSIYSRAFGSFRILLMTAQFGWMHAFAN